jgi:hypothetical protein
MSPSNPGGCQEQSANEGRYTCLIGLFTAGSSIDVAAPTHGRKTIHPSAPGHCLLQLLPCVPALLVCVVTKDILFSLLDELGCMNVRSLILFRGLSPVCVCV